MRKTICDECKWSHRCNRMDKTRGMACMDYKKEKKDVSTENKQSGAI